MSEIADQFKGLPMGDLIGGPLTAVCDAQVNLANATADFIQKIGFFPDTTTDPEKPNPYGGMRKVKFEFERQKQGEGIDDKGNYPLEKVTLDVPLLAIVKVPNLSVEETNITFDMEVKTATSEKQKDDREASLEASASYGFGGFKAEVKISGSISSSKESARSTDSSAKYHVDVKARDTGMPEGLARVMDMMNAAIAPKSVEAVPLEKGAA